MISDVINHVVAADLSVCPDQNANKPVGVDLCVYPSNMNENPNDNIKPKGQTHLSEKGRTHRSAPTDRRSLRLPHYDYSKAGYYFITICTQDKLHLFGEIEDGVMVLNEAGRMVEEWYDKLEDKFLTVQNDTMVIMPNHIHFIIQIVGADLCVRPNGNKHIHESHGCTPTVGNVIQWFKTMTTNAYIKMVKNGTLPPFNKRIWQRNYWDHVLRDDVDYHRIATYIVNNPITWENDVLSKNEYPQNDG